MSITVKFLVGGVQHQHRFSFRYMDFNSITRWEIVNKWIADNVPEGIEPQISLD